MSSVKSSSWWSSLGGIFGTQRQPAKTPPSEATRPVIDDVRLGDRSVFDHLDARAFLAYAALTPPNRLVRQAVTAWLDDYAAYGSHAWGRWAEQRNRIRNQLAQLINCAPDDIGFGTNTSQLVGDIGLMIDWKPKQRILCFKGDFPAVVTPLQNAARLFDLKLELHALDGFGDGSGDGLARVEAELKRGNVRLLAISSTQFQTGLHLPIEALAKLCHQHDAEILVDGAQSMGIVPIDVQAQGIDYMAAPTHKWMMGVEGGGVLYVNPKAMEKLVLRRSGWLSHEDGLGFLFQGPNLLRYDRPLVAKPRVVEVGASNSIGFAGLEAGLAPIVHLGQRTIFDHVQKLHDQLEPHLIELGFESLRAKDHAARSGILSVRPPKGLCVTTLGPRIAEQNVQLSLPDGLIRIAPSWPTSTQEITNTIETFHEVMRSS